MGGRGTSAIVVKKRLTLRVNQLLAQEGERMSLEVSKEVALEGYAYVDIEDKEIADYLSSCTEKDFKFIMELVTGERANVVNKSQTGADHMKNRYLKEVVKDYTLEEIEEALPRK